MKPSSLGHSHCLSLSLSLLDLIINLCIDRPMDWGCLDRFIFRVYFAVLVHTGTLTDAEHSPGGKKG